jgi:hypothetical protein
VAALLYYTASVAPLACSFHAAGSREADHEARERVRERFSSVRISSLSRFAFVPGKTRDNACGAESVSGSCMDVNFSFTDAIRMFVVEIDAAKRFGFLVFRLDRRWIARVESSAMLDILV